MSTNSIKGIGTCNGVQGLVCFHGYANAKRKQPITTSVCVALESLQTSTSIVLTEDPEVPTLTIDDLPVSDSVAYTVNSIASMFAQITGTPYTVKGLVSTNSHTPGIGLGFSGSGMGALVKAMSNATKVDLYDPPTFETIRNLTSFSCPFSLMGGVVVYESDIDSYYITHESILEDAHVFVIPIKSQKNSQTLHVDATKSIFFEATKVYGELLARKIIPTR